jgi:hypothetical protein
MEMTLKQLIGKFLHVESERYVWDGELLTVEDGLMSLQTYDMRYGDKEKLWYIPIANIVMFCAESRDLSRLEANVQYQRHQAPEMRYPEDESKSDYIFVPDSDLYDFEPDEG